MLSIVFVDSHFFACMLSLGRQLSKGKLEVPSCTDSGPDTVVCRSDLGLHCLPMPLLCSVYLCLGLLVLNF